MKSLLFVSIALASVATHAALPDIVEAEDRRQVSSEVIAKAVASKGPKLRERAALAYGRIQNPAGVDPLLKLLKDSRDSVRATAAFSVGQLGWQSEFSGGRETDLQNALVPLLADKSLLVRRRAIEALGKVGLQKTPELLATTLTAKEPELRAEAVMALSRARQVLRTRGEKEIPDLPVNQLLSLTLLAADQEPAVQRNVAYYFARNADARGEKIIAPLLKSKDVWTRAYAATGLAKMKAKQSNVDLLLSVADREEPVRIASVQALTAAGESLGKLSGLKSDESYQVRAAYAQGLNATIAAEAAELQRLLESDASFSVRAEALKSLAKIHTEDLASWLSPYFKNPQWLLREAAVQASESLAPEARLKALESAFTDTDVNVRAAALEAAGAIQTPAAFEVLKRALDSNGTAERGTAVAAMKDRKEPDVPERVWRAYSASLDRRYSEMRQDIADVFAAVPGDKTTGYLRQMLTDPEQAVRLKAQRALATRGIKDTTISTQTDLSLSPYRDLTFTKNPLVVFETSKGRFTVETFPGDARIHVASFIGLVKKGAYDNLTWHRVVPNFVVQGGDPDGTGWGDAGYSLRAEINTNLFEQGALGMPRSQGFDTGGSQLFFSLIPTPHLDGQYTVFGRVTKGLDVLAKLERGDRIIKASLQ